MHNFITEGKRQAVRPRLRVCHSTGKQQQFKNTVKRLVVELIMELVELQGVWLSSAHAQKDLEHFQKV